MAHAMTAEQVHNVLAYLVKAGKLQPVDGMVAVWRDVLTGVRYGDAIEACRSLAAGEAGWLTPGHLFGEVRRLRRARIGNRSAPAPPPSVAGDGWAQLRFQRAYIEALGDGDDDDVADERACAAVGVHREPEVLVAVDVAGLIERGGPDGAGD
ncbi:hypothetical protein [Georgenia sp. MJ170]|uniref:hypothetical protein n=1 Tax=Georgenia sunbinii TaxID=3117728 RepID=UPI002F26122C